MKDCRAKLRHLSLKMLQTEKYAAEMDALRRNKQIPSQSILAPLNLVLVKLWNFKIEHKITTGGRSSL